MDTKICKSCGEYKILNLFPRARKKEKFYYYPNCKDCERLAKAQRNKKWYNANKEEILKKGRDRHHSTPEYQRQRSLNYKKKNKEKIKENRRLRVANKRLNDPSFKLRENISRRVRKMFADKMDKSFVDYLGYSSYDLKKHLESLFEPWMSWDNYSRYNAKTWNDNDQSTWTWELDHIIPHSELKYKTVEDENFKKCWSLKNLRPLASKQNFLDGITRVRHKGNK